jgi:hypothetical protein
MLRRVSGLKNDEVLRVNEELHNLHTLPIVIRMFKSKRMRWPKHVTRMGKNRNASGSLMGRPEGKRSL